MLFQNYKSINKKVDKAFMVHSMNSFLNVAKNNSDFLVVSEKKKMENKRPCSTKIPEYVSEMCVNIIHDVSTKYTFLYFKIFLHQILQTTHKF